MTYYHTSVTRRTKRRQRDITKSRWFTCFVIYQVVVGGLSGILLGAIIINWMYPGHPIYLAIKEFLESLF